MYIHAKYICISLMGMFPLKFDQDNGLTMAALVIFLKISKKFRLVVYCFPSKILFKKTKFSLFLQCKTKENLVVLKNYKQKIFQSQTKDLCLKIYC